jgi:hypothetical protein
VLVDTGVSGGKGVSVAIGAGVADACGTVVGKGKTVTAPGGRRTGVAVLTGALCVGVGVGATLVLVALLVGGTVAVGVLEGRTVGVPRTGVLVAGATVFVGLALAVSVGVAVRLGLALLTGVAVGTGIVRVPVVAVEVAIAGVAVLSAATALGVT